MPNLLYEYLDHDRLDRLLQKATAKSGVIKREPYDEFRRRILRHKGIAERIVLPAIERLKNDKQADIVQRLRLGHGAIATLMVPLLLRQLLPYFA